MAYSPIEDRAQSNNTAKHTNMKAPIKIVQKRAYGRNHWYIQDPGIREAMKTLTNKETVTRDGLEAARKAFGVEFELPKEGAAEVSEMTNEEVAAEIKAIQQEIKDLSDGLGNRAGPDNPYYATRAKGAKRLSELSARLGQLLRAKLS